MKPMALIAACLLFIATQGVHATQQASTSTYTFRVLLDNKPIGFHEFELSQNDGAQKIDSTARFDVKFLFVTAFKYRHSSLETWNNNCLTAIDATTSSNGKQQAVLGKRVDNVLEIDSSVGARKLDGCVQTFAYWNPSILEATRLLNSQTGDYVDVDVTALGDDVLNINGEQVSALKYQLRSKPEYEGKPVDITLWYDTSKTQWLALESRAKGDRKLRYERTNPLDDVRVELSASADTQR